MKWRTFWQNAADLFRPEPRTKSADGLSEKYRDAMALVARLLRDQPISRRVMERRGMSQGRYTGARELLLATHVIDAANNLDRAIETKQDADLRLSEWVDTQRARARGSRRYTLPLSLWSF